jgi:hypothetical protein
MPEVSRFLGIVIQMFMSEQQFPLKKNRVLDYT